MGNLTFRENTYDRFIYEQIWIRNEYETWRFQSFTKNALLADIGCHAGYFSRLMLEYYDVGWVYACDIHPDNVRVARENLVDYWNQSTVYNLAAWRSDQPPGKLGHTEPGTDENGILNTGGVGVTDGEAISAIALDDIIEILLRYKKMLHFSNIIVKIDAESSEWPILLTSKRIGEVDFVLGEYHEIGGLNDDHDPSMLEIEGYTAFTERELIYFLETNGFVVFTKPYFGNLGYFWARRAK